MTTPAHYLALLAAFLAGTTACQRNTPTPPSTSADWWGSTNSPVIALWDGGISMIREPPSVIFALWADGMVVRNVDGRLQLGQVTVLEIRKLMTEVETAGFFSPPLIYGLTRPDGPVRRLAATRNGKLVCLDYDGYSDFRDVGPDAIPSRQQMEAFVGMWQRVVRAIDAVPLAQLSDYHGERELRYPSNSMMRMPTNHAPERAAFKPPPPSPNKQFTSFLPTHDHLGTRLGGNFIP